MARLKIDNQLKSIEADLTEKFVFTVREAVDLQCAVEATQKNFECHKGLICKKQNKLKKRGGGAQVPNGMVKVLA